MSLNLVAPGRYTLRLATRPVTPNTLQGQAAADVDMNGHDMTGVQSVTFGEEFDNGDSGAAKTIALAAGSKQKIRITAPTVLTIDPTGAGIGNTQIRLIMDGVGGHSVAFVGLSAGNWVGSASQPDVNSLANGKSYLNIFFDGTGMDQSLVPVGI